MYRMSGVEYKQIFKENGLERSELVLLLEQQVKILIEHGRDELAEEAKWLAIFTAQDEKQQGWGYLEDVSKDEQIWQPQNSRLRASI